MNRYGSYVRLLVTGLVLSTSARAQTTPMKLDDALARARQRAPQIIAAQGQIAETQGRLLGASVLLQENPVMAGSVGPRRSEVRKTTDFDIEVSQSFEVGGRRAARIAGARAGVERETANSSDVLRRLLRDVSAAFARGLAAQERVRLATAAEGVANELLSSMQRRYEAGDVPVLDVNLARSSTARARAETSRRRGELHRLARSVCKDRPGGRDLAEPRGRQSSFRDAHGASPTGSCAARSGTQAAARRRKDCCSTRHSGG